jgi:hypothetical protein
MLCIARGVKGENIALASGEVNDAVPNYCGIYSLYVAARLQESPVQFLTLVDGRYVGSSRGSSLKELADAATTLGLKHEICEFTTTEYVRTQNTRAILHVKRGPESKKADHWILVVGEQSDDRVLIFDPENLSLTSVPWSELVARWDRAALVFPSPGTSSNRLHLMITAVVPCASIALIIFLIKVIVDRRFPRNQSGVKAPMGVVAGLVGMGALIAVGFHVFSTDGLLRNRSGIEFVHQSFQLSRENQ